MAHSRSKNKDIASSSLAAVHLYIRGRVQGIGYRYYAEQTATSLCLSGWVRNLLNGDVEAEAEGPRPVIEQWIIQLREGPPLARIDHIQEDWHAPSNLCGNFTIRS
jgi:acylphosphatase